MKNCQICNGNMSEKTYKKSTDFICNKEDHLFGMRFEDDSKIITKIRITDNDKTMFVKFNFLSSNIEVSTIKDDFSPMIIDGIFEPDLSDLEKFKQKIKKYIIFI